MFIGEGEMSDATRLSAIMLGTAATTEWTQETATSVNNCPWAAATVCTGSNVPFMFAFLANHRWGIEHISERPQRTLGLEHAELLWGRRTEIPRSWAMGTILGCEGQAPCGVPCPDRLSHRQQCEGFPAVAFWQPPTAPVAS